MEHEASNGASPRRPTVARVRAVAPGRGARRAALAGMVLTVFASPQALAQVPADRWGGPDKALHFGVSAPLGAIGAGFAPKDAGTGQRLLYGAAIGALPGLAKELADARRPGGDPSARDMAFNVLGAAVGALFADCCLLRPISRGDRIDGIGVEYRIDF